MENNLGQVFREFLLSSAHSVKEMSFTYTKYSARKQADVEMTNSNKIVKFSTENAEIIPFVSLRYNTGLIETGNFERVQYLTPEGMYLVKEDLIIFPSEYTAKDYLSYIGDIKWVDMKVMLDEINTKVIQTVKDKVASMKASVPPLVVDDENRYVFEQLGWWYREGKPADEFLFRNLTFDRKLEGKPVTYVRQYLNGEDFYADIYGEYNFELAAQKANFIDECYKHSDSDPVIQREKQMYHITKDILKDAASINVVKYDGTTVKVENGMYSTSRDGYAVGTWRKNVPVTDIKHITYKRKIYGDTPPPVKPAAHVDFDDEENATATCGFCGIVLKEEFINMVDYEDDVCVTCEKTRTDLV